MIFAPGFSTANAVTDLSGRGVGMDVVRSNVARIGGRVSVSTSPGQGTTVRFTLPFTVLMVQVMTVEVAGQTFGIPIECVVESVRIPRDRVFRVGAAEALVLRGRTVPLLRLSETLDLPANSGHGSDACIVVVRLPAEDIDGSNADGDQGGAIEVDGFGERMDVMLRPMEGLLAGMGAFAGTTLLGDGRVLIVLDIQELLRRQVLSG